MPGSVLSTDSRYRPGVQSGFKSSCHLSLLCFLLSRKTITLDTAASYVGFWRAPHVCRRARASERDNESKRNRGDRAIDKTPNAARPRLILQAYTHPLVFSLSSPTTHPLDHYPLPPPPPPAPPPPPPLLSSLTPASFTATLRKSPSYPLRASPSPNATHPLRGNPRTLGAADILHLSPFSFSISLYLFPTLPIFS